MEIKVGKKNVVDYHRSSITVMFVVVSYVRYREVHKNCNPSAILRPLGWNTSNPLVTRNSGNTVSMYAIRWKNCDSPPLQHDILAIRFPYGKTRWTWIILVWNKFLSTRFRYNTERINRVI